MRVDSLITFKYKIMEILTKTSHRVKLLLDAMPELRDSDTMLHQAIRREDVHTYDGSIFDNLTGREISMLERMGVITKLDAVSRARRIVEEKNPKLRGNSYQARQEKAGIVRAIISSI